MIWLEHRGKLLGVCFQGLLVLMLAGIAVLVAASLTASPAYAATTQAEVKTTSDGLNYCVGDFIRKTDFGMPGAVYTGTIQERQKELEAEWKSASDGTGTSVAEIIAPAYGVTFTVEERRTATANGSGEVTQGKREAYLNCGHGVYVVGDVDDGESGKQLVIPNTIEGLPVVYANVRGDSGVDISRCESLRHFTLRGGSAVLGAKNAKSLVSITINSFEFKRVESIDLSPAQNAQEIVFRRCPANFALPLDELRSLSVSSDGDSGAEHLDLAGAAKLKKLYVAIGSLSNGSLNLDGCTSLEDVQLSTNCLTSFDVSKFPALKTLDVEYNYISDLTQLKAWGAQAGHTLNVEGQLTPEHTISPSEVTLSGTSFVYDGTAKRPTVTIPGLEPGFDYRVDYRDNVQAGTATVYVTGLRDYRGSLVSKTFTIVNQSSNAGTVAKPKPAPIPSAKPAPTSLAKASVAVKSKTWTGKTLKPAAPVVKLGGKTLRAGTDYTWACKGGKASGSYKVTVTGKGAYAGTATATFKILPKGTSVSKLSKAKRAFTVKWKSPSKAALKQVTGYQVRWSTSKKFTAKTTKTKTVKAASAAGKKRTLKVAKLKAKKTYYVQVRTYKKVGKATYYSAWSKAKAVKTK
ncbi:fibronectin type III domain-containing protein [Eggerthellaceae bacterium 24-137]